MESVRKEECRHCGADIPRPAAGANQPVKMGDMFLMMKAQGLHTAANIALDHIVTHDKASGK